MTKFAILLIAIVLAPGLHVFVESRDLPLASADPLTYDDEEPIVIPEIRPLPLPVAPEVEEETVIVPELRPLPVVPELSPEEETVIVPELRPLPVVPEEENVVAPELRPLPVVEEPCAACFAYMSSLIDQLTDTVAQPSDIEYLPELENAVVRPLPLPAVVEGPVLRPSPVETEIVPETRPVFVQAVAY